MPTDAARSTVSLTDTGTGEAGGLKPSAVFVDSVSLAR